MKKIIIIIITLDENTQHARIDMDALANGRNYNYIPVAHSRYNIENENMAGLGLSLLCFTPFNFLFSVFLLIFMFQKQMQEKWPI